MKYKGIIFDFNGTLFFDSKKHLEAWREFSHRLRGTAFTDDEMRKYMFGRTNEDIIAYAIQKRPTKEQVEKYGKEKEALYRDMCRKDLDNFKLAPGAVEFLDWLKENNIPRTIATMSEKDNVDFYIEGFNLAQWFDVNKIVYSDGTMRGKPAPDIYEIAAAKLNRLLRDWQKVSILLLLKMHFQELRRQKMPALEKLSQLLLWMEKMCIKIFLALAGL